MNIKNANELTEKPPQSFVDTAEKQLNKFINDNEFELASGSRVEMYVQDNNYQKYLRYIKSELSRAGYSCEFRRGEGDQREASMTYLIIQKKAEITTNFNGER